MMARREFFFRSAAVVVMASAAIFVAVRAAVAREGATGVARTWVTVAGTVTGLPGDPRSVAMRFAFHRPGEPMPLCAPTVSDVRVEPGGAFSAQVPLDEAVARCPPDMLDGRNVQVDVDVGALRVVTNANINPVPYAHFATTAGGVVHDSPLDVRLRDQSGAAMAIAMCAIDERIPVDGGASLATTPTSVVDAVNIPVGSTGVEACRRISSGYPCLSVHGVYPRDIAPSTWYETNRFDCNLRISPSTAPMSMWACCAR